jgi:hypothetical protein
MFLRAFNSGRRHLSYNFEEFYNMFIYYYTKTFPRTG